MKNMHFFRIGFLMLLIMKLFISTLQAQQVPEKLYFKFDSSGNQYNWASAPGGNNPATLSGLTIDTSGQFNKALKGNGATSTSNRLSTGWATNLPSTGWTISFWLKNFPATASTTYYFFGDINAASFRCFTGGVAGNNALMVRGTGLTDVPITNIGSSPIVLHIVYTGSAILVYKNGTYSSTVSQSSVTISGSGPFLVGGYSSSNSFSSGCLMDEFRLYTRALSQTEISATYNQQLPVGGGNAGIRAITSPADTFCSGSKTVTVRLKNFHYKTLSNVTINWKVNNTAQTAYNWTGSLATNDSTLVNIGSYNFASGTSYSIKAYTTSPNGGTDSVASNDTAVKSGYMIRPSPNAIITAAGSTALCLGDSVLLSTDTGSSLSYQWYKDTLILSGITSRTYYASRQADYKVVVNNSYNCPKTSSPKSVTVDTITTINATPLSSTTFCQGDSVRINATSGSGYSYKWKKDGNLIAGATKSYYTANSSGSYRVIVNTRNNGCIDSSADVAVTVNQRPTASITVGGQSALCLGDSVALIATSGTGLTYQWKLDASVLQNDTNETCYGKRHGYYTLIVNNIYNCPQTSNPVLVTVDTLLTPTLTPVGSSSLCQGDSVRLNGPTGSGMFYSWKKDNVLLTGASKSYFYAALTGNYMVIVNKKNICLDSSSSLLISVNPRPVKTVAADGPLTFCNGDSVVFQADTTAGLSYQWKKNGNSIPGAVKSAFTAKDPGSYRVVLTTAAQCVDSSSAYTVKVNALPAATATALGPTTFCLGDSVRINANISIGLTYKWKYNGVIIPNATKSFIFAKKSGDYKVVVTNMSNCSDSSKAVTIFTNPLPIASTTPDGSQEICNGDSMVINSNTDTGFIYQWIKNGANIPGATASNIVTKTAGAFKVIITNSFGCKDTSAIVTVSVNPSPDAKITATGPTSFCDGDSVILKANFATGISYNWYWEGLPLINETDSFISAKKSGLYLLKTTLGKCSKTSQTVLVNVKKNPVTFLGADTSVCANSNIVLNAGSGYNDYLWSTGETTQTITVDSTGVGLGTKTISVRVTLDGCKGYDTIKIIFVKCAGIKEGSNSNFVKIYPNPSSGSFNLEFSDLTGRFDIIITEMNGKIVFSENVVLKGGITNHQINLSSVTKGMYIIKIASKSEIRSIQLMIE